MFFATKEVNSSCVPSSNFHKEAACLTPLSANAKSHSGATFFISSIVFFPSPKGLLLLEDNEIDVL